MRSRLSYLPIVLGFFILVLSIPVFTYHVASDMAPKRTFETKAASEVSAVSMIPSRGTFSLSSRTDLPIGVVLESGTKKVASVDFVIRFDPSAVRVSALTRGMGFENYPSFKIDEKNGLIYISGTNKTEKEINGIIASFRLAPKRAGSLELKFESSTGVEKSTGIMYTITK